MENNIDKVFFLLEIMAFECGAMTYLYYEVNSCDQQWTCYQTVVNKSQAWLEDVFLK